MARRHVDVIFVAVCLAVGVLLPGCTPSPPPSPVSTPTQDAALREELLAMARDDQAERTGAGLPPGTRLGPPRDVSRALRLEEIVAARGWPTHELVGEQAARAARLVAQHADVDVAFQQQARDLLAEAVARGQADPVDLAYLTDRVAVNTRTPQTYGSQIRCRAGRPAPATPLRDEAQVDALRAEVGLGSLADYYAELATACANEELDGQAPS